MDRITEWVVLKLVIFTVCTCVCVCVWVGVSESVRDGNSIMADKLSSGYFPGVRVLKTDISEHCIGSIFNRCCNVSED